MIHSPRIRRRAPPPALVAALALALAPAACVDSVPPPWRIDGPRLLLVEMEVVATGPYSPPLADDPPGRTRRQGLPGDRVSLRPIAVEPGGPIDLSGSAIWLREGRHDPDEPIPPCAADGGEGQGRCRLEGPEVVLPPVTAPHGFVLTPSVVVIAGDPGGPPAETCLGRWIADPPAPLTECLIATVPLRYGPAHQVAALTGGDPDVPVTAPDYNLDGAALHLEVRGPSGVRDVVASHGQTITVEADDEIVATPSVDESQLQYFVVGDPPTVTIERVQAQWYTDAELFAAGSGSSGASQRFSIPPGVDGFDLHLDLSERSGPGGSNGAGRWLWVRFEVEGGSGGIP